MITATRNRRATKAVDVAFLSTIHPHFVTKFRQFRSAFCNLVNAFCFRVTKGFGQQNACLHSFVTH